MLSTSAPLIGEAGSGTESDTPAIGPATFGLSGFRLFSASHALTPSATTPNPANLCNGNDDFVHGDANAGQALSAGRDRFGRNAPYPDVIGRLPVGT